MVINRFKRRFSLKDLVMYASATDDYNEIHYNFEYAKKAGFEKPLVHGMFNMALCVKAITDAILPTKIKKISAKFKKPVPLDSEVEFVAEKINEKNYKVSALLQGEEAVLCTVETE